MSICAVIPAAGRGTRLGLGPKLLVDVGRGQTVWTLLRDRLRRVADALVVVLSPEIAPLFEAALGPDDEDVTIALQSAPRGMGDAIWCARDSWRHHPSMIVMWGDQVNVSDDTVRRTVEAHAAVQGARMTVPLVEMVPPYVQYVIEGERLVAVRETREGDTVDDVGLSDIGTFMLETAGLDAAWTAYQQTATPGRNTGEANFLPFLAWLSRERGWRCSTLRVADAAEARGINTPDDLTWFRRLRA